jgi:DNA-binding PadR family transcriptional regulator
MTTRTKMTPRFNDSSSAMDWIKKSLKEYPAGMSENQLNTRHNPVLIGQLLTTLEERGIISVHINEKEVGPARRIFKLNEGVN